MGPITLTNPAMIYLAAAAVLPIIIHLLSRRSTRVVPFPAVRFLRRTPRGSMARVNLKHLLLMLLRMVLILLVAVILARPIFGPSAGRDPDRPLAGASAVLVLDDTLSMNYRRGDTSWFERARNRALEIIDQLPPDVEVAVMTTSRPAVQFTRDRDELRAQVTGRRASFAAGSCWEALQRASGALQQRAARALVIYLLTDMTRSAWPRPGGPVRADSDVPVLDLGEAVALEIVAVGDVDASNVAVTRLSHQGEPLIQGAVLNLEAELLCTGRQSEELAQFEFDGRMVDRRTVHLPADGTAKVVFQLPIASPGHHWGRVSLQNPDALPQDNARAFSLDVAGTVSVLCVDEFGAGAARAGGSYLFRMALSPWERPERGLFRVKAVTQRELQEEQLAQFDVVALFDLPGPSESAWERLADFVAGGGGLLVSAGPGVEAQGYGSRRARRLLPAVPGGVVSAPGGADGPFRVRVVKPGHSLAAALAEAEVDVGRIVLRKCRRLELTAGGEEVLGLGEGLPALVVGRAGGRVAVFAGGFGAQWSEFPRELEFVPFCQELVLYLAGAGGAQLTSFLVGQHVPVRFDPSSSPSVITVIPPGGGQGVELMPGATPERRLFWQTRSPGYYRVAFERGGRRWHSGFCINTAPQESDLRTVAASDVRAAVKAGKVSVHRDVSTLSIARAGGAVAGWAGLELTPYLVVLALCVGVAEVFLANRLYRASAPEIGGQ